MPNIKVLSIHLFINQMLWSQFEAEVDIDDIQNVKNSDLLTQEEIFEAARNLKDCFDLQNNKMPYDQKLEEEESKKIGVDMLHKLNLNCLISQQSYGFYVLNRQQNGRFELGITICVPSII